MPVIKSVINVIYCIGFSNLYIELTLDSQWWDFRDAFRRNGVTVVFICEDDIQRLHGST